MTISPVNLSKDHPDLPDFYTVTIDHINGKSEVIEVASHVVVDKIFFFDDKGKMASWEPHAVPYIEFCLKNNTYKCVATANAAFTYDKNWTKIVKIRKEMQKAKENTQ